MIFLQISCDSQMKNLPIQNGYVPNALSKLYQSVLIIGQCMDSCAARNDFAFR
jgi:hypothetical protein